MIHDMLTPEHQCVMYQPGAHVATSSTRAGTQES